MHPGRRQRTGSRHHRRIEQAEPDGVRRFNGERTPRVDEESIEQQTGAEDGEDQVEADVVAEPSDDLSGKEQGDDLRYAGGEHAEAEQQLAGAERFEEPEEEGLNRPGQHSVDEHRRHEDDQLKIVEDEADVPRERTANRFLANSEESPNDDTANEEEP